MSQTPVVELQAVSKTFAGRVKAVDDVTLSIHTGETVALLGTSGCGKTTTLRLINRLIDPDAGSVLVRGRPVGDQRPETLRRSIGYVIQEGGLFPHLSVAENVATVPGLLRWPRDKTQQRVGEVLDLVGLPPDEFAPRKPGELSGGQRQRVGVARALASDPDLLLMDEPFGAIDPITRESLHAEFRRLQNRLKKTVVFVTHDMLEAGILADRVVLMHEGRIAQEGSMRDLLFEPANEFARSFFAAHKQQMVFEALRLDEVLDDVDPVDSPGQAPVVHPAGDAPVRDALDAIVRSAPDAVVVPSAGRHQHQAFPVEAVRKTLFSELAS